MQLSRPTQDGAPAVAHALGHVAAFVVAVAGAGVGLQQVIQQLAGRVPQGIVGRGRVDDVACWVELKRLAFQAAVGLRQRLLIMSISIQLHPITSE